MIPPPFRRASACTELQQQRQQQQQQTRGAGNGRRGKEDGSLRAPRLKAASRYPARTITSKRRVLVAAARRRGRLKRKGGSNPLQARIGESDWMRDRWGWAKQSDTLPRGCDTRESRGQFEARPLPFPFSSRSGCPGAWDPCLRGQARNVPRRVPCGLGCLQSRHSSWSSCQETQGPWDVTWINVISFFGRRSGTDLDGDPYECARYEYVGMIQAKAHKR